MKKRNQPKKRREKLLAVGDNQVQVSPLSLQKKKKNFSGTLGQWKNRCPAALAKWRTHTQIKSHTAEETSAKTPFL